MATVAGGVAVRKAFTGALANEIAKADGRRSMLDIVECAVIEMKSNENRRINQCPETRSTLTKSLILPPGRVEPEIPPCQLDPPTDVLIQRLLA